MTPVQLFLRRMQWRPVGSSVPEPAVALLGPPGSGKSTTLRALSQECGGTIVHATLDFAENANLDPISAVAFVAFSFMRGWTNLRRRPVFHRLGLSLLALNEPLGGDRAAARVQIKRLIRQYLQRQPLVQAGEQVPDLLFTAAQVATAVGGIAVPAAVPAAQLGTVKERAKPVIGALLRGAARWGLRDAMRWPHTIAEAEDASTVDYLIDLSTARRADALNLLMKALLADIDDFTRNHPAAAATCDCAVPQDGSGRAHEHVWVLLLDNAQSTLGEQFLGALTRAKQEGFTTPDEVSIARDPLLTVVAVDRWRPAWNQWWREPWQTAATVPDRQPVPLFSEASRKGWAEHLERPSVPQVNPARAWYPVWLDPAADIGVINPRSGSPWDKAELETLVSRLASGQPAAMVELQAEIAALDAVSDGPRPATILDAKDDAGAPLWERAANACQPSLLPTQRPWQAVPPAVVVAARLSESGRPSDELPPDAFPNATQSLRELRANLWVSTFAARPSPLWRVGRDAAEHPAVLHPWLARCLLAGLAAEGGNAEPPSWDGLFAAFFDIEPRPGRTLFRDLARGRFDAVVKELVGMFDTIDHRAWIRALDDATSAPCRLPHNERFAASYRRLAPDHLPGRTPIEAAVTSLTALLWLYRDPLSVPGLLYGTAAKVPWHKQVQTDFGKLASGSARSDVSALEEAASQFESLT
jgi:hypothetical protein